MDFNSWIYILFLIIGVTTFWSLKNNTHRQILLFAFSLIFYGFWRFEYLFLLLLIALFNYWISYLILKHEQFTKQIMIFGITTDLLILFYYKYINFFLFNVQGFSDMIGMNVNIVYIDVLLPIGISFYTFQAMSYVVDVYRDRSNYIDKPLLYMNYIIFWPQMIAGPIIRASEIVYQFQKKSTFKIEYITRGVYYILAGLLMKLILADNIGHFVDDGFATDIKYLNFLDAWTLAFGFGFQIYFDFAGYTMIAIGSAYLFGYDLPKNFFFPYQSANIREFWKRWHITLSAWIRDYLYVPLTGQKFSKEKSKSGIEIHNGNENFALFATWGIMGLWHGASWGFFLWGIYQALLIFIYRVFHRRIKIKMPKAIAWGITILAVMASWIFFRAESVGDALQLYRLMFDVTNFHLKLGFRENFYLLVFLYLIGTIVMYFFFVHKDKILQYAVVRNTMMYSFFTVGFFLLFIEMRQVAQFIYFQF